MSITWLHVLIACGVAINALSLLGALYSMHRRQKPRSTRQVVATVILPLTGEAPDLEGLFGALNVQTLLPRRLIVTVESEDDPAYARALAMAPSAAFPVETVVAGPASVQAQKCRNQIAALQRIDDKDEAIVLMDGDIAPMSWWLSALVSPLADGHADVVTGRRWQMVAEPRLGAHLVAVIDRAVMLTPRLVSGFLHLVWGGSFAISREAAARMDLAQCLEGTLSDDLSVSEKAAAAGLRILTRGALLVPSPSRLDLAPAWNFARRQYQIVRIYMPRLWWLAAVTINVRLAAWAGALWAVATSGSMMPGLFLMSLLALAKQIAVGLVGARLGLPDPPAVRITQILLCLAQPLVDVFHSSVILAAASTRQVRWGHVVYEVEGPYAIRVKDRRPFPVSQK